MRGVMVRESSTSFNIQFFVGEGKIWAYVSKHTHAGGVLCWSRPECGRRRERAKKRRTEIQIKQGGETMEKSRSARAANGETSQHQVDKRKRGES